MIFCGKKFVAGFKQPEAILAETYQQDEKKKCYKSTKRFVANTKLLSCFIFVSTSSTRSLKVMLPVV